MLMHNSIRYINYSSIALNHRACISYETILWEYNLCVYLFRVFIGLSCSLCFSFPLSLGYTVLERDVPFIISDKIPRDTHKNAHFAIHTYTYTRYIFWKIQARSACVSVSLSRNQWSILKNVFWMLISLEVNYWMLHKRLRQFISDDYRLKWTIT